MKVDIYNTDKKYNIIYADPPWSYKDKKCNGNCEQHYNTMNIKEICDLHINQIASKDCTLFLWVTYPMLQEGMEVIKQWGFKYKTIGFQWIKQNRSCKGFFFRIRKMDKRKYRMLFNCYKRQTS